MSGPDLTADNLLMLTVRNGDVAKMAALFERHHRMLFNFFLRLTGNRAASEDLVQDVFFRMLKYRHTYQPDNDFLPWMYRIARNAHVDYTRKPRLELISGSHDEASAEPGPHEQLERNEETELLRRALARLPVEKREVLVLSRFQNLKYGEIAEIMNCEPGTVKVRVYRAMRDLGEIYFELSGERAS